MKKMFGLLIIAYTVNAFAAEPFTPSVDDQAAFFKACKLGSANDVKSFLNRGFDPNMVFDSNIVEPSNPANGIVFAPSRFYRGATPFEVAFHERKYEVMKQLVYCGADPNKSCAFSGSPLFSLVTEAGMLVKGKGNYSSRTSEIVRDIKMLREFGARVDLADQSGSTPLSLAQKYYNDAKTDHEKERMRQVLSALTSRN